MNLKYIWIQEQFSQLSWCLILPGQHLSFESCSEDYPQIFRDQGGGMRYVVDFSDRLWQLENPCWVVGLSFKDNVLEAIACPLQSLLQFFSLVTTGRQLDRLSLYRSYSSLVTLNMI